MTEKVLWRPKLFGAVAVIANRLERVIEAHPALDSFVIAEEASMRLGLFRHLLSPHSAERFQSS